MVEYHCYTDGSCKAGEGAPGGWGFVINAAGLPAREGYGKVAGTLAKVMEYRAVAEALRALPTDATAIVYSDNQALIENLDKRLGDWGKSGFVKVDRQIVDEVRSIHAQLVDKRLRIRWQWLRSHNGNAGNERADALAAQGAREAKAELPRRR